MGMEGLGRIFNLVPTANGVGINLRDGDSMSFLFTGADTYTFSVSTSFAGTYQAASFFTPTWTPIVRVYTNTSATGTAAWVKTNQTASAVVVVAGAVGLVTLFSEALPDTYKYVKCTHTGAGLVTAIQHELMIQRSPNNMPLLSA